MKLLPNYSRTTPKLLLKLTKDALGALSFGDVHVAPNSEVAARGDVGTSAPRAARQVSSRRVRSREKKAADAARVAE
eukprot:2017786-Prymnesium_polylepis.2